MAHIKFESEWDKWPMLYTSQIKGKIHGVFHVSCLKKKLGSTTHIQIELPMLDDEGKLVLELECILEIKTRTIHSRSVNVYLIKRINLPDDEATWEN